MTDNKPQNPTEQVAKLVKFTAISPEVVGKKFWMNGVDLASETAPAIVTADMKTLTISGMDEMVALLNSLTPGKDVLQYQIPALHVNGATRINRDARDDDHNEIKRTGENFDWDNGPGVMMFDVDVPMDRAELLQIVTGVAPTLGVAKIVSVVSSSSFIYWGQNQLKGQGGQRLYLGALDASDIPRAGGVLFKRLWLAGHGRIELTSNGRMMKKTIIDASVWDDVSLDFAAGAHCAAGLTQYRQAEIVPNGGFLDWVDTKSAFPDLTPEEEARYEALVQAAETAKAPEAAQVRENWIQAREASGQGTREELEQVARGEEVQLPRSFVIHLDRRQSVTVGEIMDNPADYQKVGCCSPLEPEYGNWSGTKAYIWAEKGVIIDHAHGLRRRFKIGTGEEQMQRLIDMGVIPAAPALPPKAQPVRAATTGRIVTPDTSQDEMSMELGAAGWNDRARFVSTTGQFMFWNDSLWEVDDKRRSFTLVRDFLRWKADQLEDVMLEAIERAEDEKAARKIEHYYRRIQKEIKSNAYVAAVHTLMQSNPGTVVTTDDLNPDKMKLGTPTGTVDLRTGILMQSDRAELITKSVAVTPAPPGTPAPIWQKFLNKIMAGDQELIDLLQRCAGYALTGKTTEHKFAFLYGTGRNGKGVFLNTMIGIMGAYGRKAPASVFLESHNSDHPTQLAGLQGMRMVFGAEIAEGQFWNETLLKDATGGDVLTARYMRQDFFDFIPEFFLMIAGNNQPALRGTDQAIRDRIMLIPFTVYIAKEDRDPDLADKLRAEWPAILRWMIDGCLEWQRGGLRPPASVLAASNDYVDSEDFLGQFLNDECETGIKMSVQVSVFCDRYNAWRQREGLKTLPNVKIKKEMQKRGYVQRKMRTEGMTNQQSPVMCFDGLKVLVLKAPQLPPPE